MADLSSDEQFKKVLFIAESQLKKKRIQVRFGPQGKMRFIIDEASLKVALAESGLDEPAFREIFHSEVGPLLEATIRGAVDQYIESGPQVADVRVADPATRKARQATLRQRANLVATALETPELRARYLIKVASKHPRLRLLNWEVAKKIELSSKESWLQPYATINVETIRPEPQLGIFSWFSFFPTESIGRSESCTFDCDEGDLDDLMQIIQDAKAALRKAGQAA